MPTPGPEPAPAPPAAPGRPGRAAGFRLRPAVAADGAAIAGLYRRSFAATFGHRYPAAELAEFLALRSAEFFARAATDPAAAVILGFDSGARLAGYAWLGAHPLGAAIPDLVAARRWWALRHLYLELDARGSGLADRLLDAAIAESRARQMQDLYLTVLAENGRARRFYARRGFAEVGVYPYRLGQSVDTDHILRLAL